MEADMEDQNGDARFCRAALDGLKSFRRIEFTARFMDEHNLPREGKNLADMWNDIDQWLAEMPVPRCRLLCRSLLH